MSQEDRAKAKRDEITRAISNVGMGDIEAVAELTAWDHRTIQQNVMRFCAAYIRAVAKHSEHNGFDMRNEQTVAFANKVVEAVDPDDMRFPYV